MNAGKVVLGVAAGVAAGALLGVLFAPEKGSRTRRHLLNKKDDLKDELEDKFNEFIEKVSDKYEKVKSDITDFTQGTKINSEPIKKV